MNYKNIYLNIIKNKINYDLIFLNKKKQIWLNTVINKNLLNDLNFYLKKYKFFFKQNGLKIIILQNWYKFGLKYNLILKILKK